MPRGRIMKKSDINKKKAADAVVKSTRGEVYEWIQCLVFALVFCVIVFVFLYIYYIQIYLFI